VRPWERRKQPGYRPQYLLPGPRAIAPLGPDEMSQFFSRVNQIRQARITPRRMTDLDRFRASVESSWRLLID
jgi:hypothetical protein